MDKKKLLSLSTAGALTLSMLQGFSSLNASATLMPLKRYQAELVLNSIAAEDLEHVKVSDLQKLIVVKDYAKVQDGEEGNGYSNGDDYCKDCAIADIAGMPSNISFARYDSYEDSYEVLTGDDEFDLSDYEATSANGRNLSVIVGTAKQIDDDHNVWLDLTICRNISKLPKKDITVDLSAYTIDEQKNYPVDNLKKDLKCEDKDFDISKATKVWIGESKEYTFGKGQTIDIRNMGGNDDDYYDDDDYNESFVIGSGRYAIDTAKTDCMNTNYTLSKKTLEKQDFSVALYTKGEDGKLSPAQTDRNEISDYSDSYYDREVIEPDANGNVDDYDDWDWTEDDDGNYNEIYYRFINNVNYNTKYARYFGKAINNENYFKLIADKEKIDSLKNSGVDVNVYKFKDIQALAGEDNVFKVKTIPTITKPVTDSILSYEMYDDEEGYKQTEVEGVRVDLSTRSLDNVFAVVYSRPSDDGASSTVVSYDFVVASGSMSMLTDGSIDIRSTDGKYEDETDSEGFYTNNDSFDAAQGKFEETGSNDISYRGYLDQYKGRAIDKEHYLVFNNFTFTGHNPNEKGSLYEFERYQYDEQHDSMVLTDSPVTMKPGNSSRVSLYDDSFKTADFDINDYKIVLNATITKGENEEFYTYGEQEFKLYQGNFEAAGYSPEYYDTTYYTYSDLSAGDKVSLEVDCEEYGIKLNDEKGFDFNVQTQLYMTLDSVQLVKIDKGTYKVRPSKVYAGTYTSAKEIEEAEDIKDVTDAILANGDNKGYKLEALKKDADIYYKPYGRYCSDPLMSDYDDDVYEYFTLVFADGTIKNLSVSYNGYFTADADKTPPTISLDDFNAYDSTIYDEEAGEYVTNPNCKYVNDYTYYDGDTLKLHYDISDNVDVDHCTFTINGEAKELTLNSYYDFVGEYTATYDMGTLKEGVYTIVATAYDKAGNNTKLTAELTVLKKPDQPIDDPDEEPQVFNDVPIRTGIDPFFTATGVLYKNDKGEYVEADSDYYVLSNRLGLVDSLGSIGYQTVLVKNDLSTEQMSQLKLVYKSADTVKNWEDGTLTKLKIYKENVLQKSGETVNDFSKGYVHYSAITDNEDKKAHVDKVRNYQVNVVTQHKGGAKLYVNGPDEREVMFNELYGYSHDVSIINTGDANLTGLKAELVDAKNVKLDKYWVVGGENNSTLKPVYDNNGDSYVAKVRLLPDGDGEISGKLKISADGQEDKIIVLKGRAGNPRITIKEIDPAVKFVPYSNLIATSNMYDWVTVSFRLKPEYKMVENQYGDLVEVPIPTDYKLPEGITLNPENGELYGTPQKAGEYEFTVEAIFTVDPYYADYVSFKNSSVDLKLVVKPNENEIVYSASDEGYPVKQSVGTDQGEHDFVLDYELEADAAENEDYPLTNVDDLEDILFISDGEYGNYKKFWFNGEELEDGEDFTSKSGSTEITIKSQTLKNKVRSGENTIAIEFRNKDGELKRTAQNFRVNVKKKEVHIHNWGEWEITTKPTTEKEGVKTRTCLGCGEKQTDIVPVHKHNWSDWKVTVEPTIEAEGEMTRTCPECGETEKDTIPKKDPESEDPDAPDVINGQTDKDKPSDGGKTIDITPVPANDTIAVDMLVYLIDANDKPVADKLVEIHSDVYSARTSSSGYAKYLGVESGKHRISVIDDNGNAVAEKAFEIVKGDSISLSGDVITAYAGSEVMMTVKMDGDKLELVAAGEPKTMDNDKLDITEENVTGDPDKAKESKEKETNKNNSSNSSTTNNGAGNNASNVNGGGNNPTTGNPAAAFGVCMMLAAVSVVISKKKHR